MQQKYKRILKYYHIRFTSFKQGGKRRHTCVVARVLKMKTVVPLLSRATIGSFLVLELLKNKSIVALLCSWSSPVCLFRRRHSGFGLPQTCPVQYSSPLPVACGLRGLLNTHTNMISISRIVGTIILCHGYNKIAREIVYYLPSTEMVQSQQGMFILLSERLVRLKSSTYSHTVPFPYPLYPTQKKRTKKSQ